MHIYQKSKNILKKVKKTGVRSKFKFCVFYLFTPWFDLMLGSFFHILSHIWLEWSQMTADTEFQHLLLIHLRGNDTFTMLSFFTPIYTLIFAHLTPWMIFFPNIFAIFVFYVIDLYLIPILKQFDSKINISENLPILTKTPPDLTPWPVNCWNISTIYEIFA